MKGYTSQIVFREVDRQSAPRGPVWRCRLWSIKRMVAMLSAVGSSALKLGIVSAVAQSSNLFRATCSCPASFWADQFPRDLQRNTG